MQFSNACLNLVMKFEGLSTTAYRCPAGVLTLGFGHTKDVKPDQKITKDGAVALLKEDLAEFSAQVTNLLDGAYVTQGQFDALVSFAFNLGIGKLATSTLLKNVKAGNYSGAAGEFERWVFAGSKQLPGLAKRRAAERALFESE